MTVTRWTAIILWAAAVGLSVFLSARLGEASIVSEPADPLSRFLGSAKEAFGDTLFVKADVYFHGGVMQEEHHDESADEVSREGLIAEENIPEEAPKDWIAGMNRRIQVHEVTHLGKDKRKEMLPFFAMATALDPRNTEAVLTAAYWLENEFGRTQEAAGVLEKGLRDNPDSWEIENALGKFYFRQKKWASAETHLKRSAALSDGKKIENYSLVDLYYHLAESRAALGMNAQALQSYGEAEKYFDDKTTPYLRSVILDKIRHNAMANPSTEPATESSADSVAEKELSGVQ